MARSPADQGKTLLETIENARAESRSRNENFTGITKDDIGKKTKAKDPFLSGFGWTKETPPGGRIDLRLFIGNAGVANIYVHVWVGSGNIDPVVGTFLTNVDPRFPRLTEPSFPGLAEFPGVPHPFPLPPGAKRLDFSLAVPASVEESIYLGNICLMQLEGFTVGRHVARAVFPFAVRRSAAAPSSAMR